MYKFKKSKIDKVLQISLLINLAMMAAMALTGLIANIFYTPDFIDNHWYIFPEEGEDKLSSSFVTF